MTSFCKSVEAACAWFGRISGWLTPLLVISVCLGVLMVQLRLNVLAEWTTPVPLFGTHISVNSLLDLQWHLFAVLVMLGGVYALHTDAHVRVDFIAARFTPRTRRIVSLLGDLLFLLPFAVLMTWFSWAFAVSAFRVDEGSSYGGLLDRWIVKGGLPLGFALLALLGAARAVRTAIEIARGGGDAPVSGPER